MKLDYRQMAVSEWCKTNRLPEPEPEFRFAPPRRWRFDLAWPDLRLALEIEGATWANGRHTRGAGYAADVEKYNAATLAGWRVIRATTDHVDDGDAFVWLRDAFDVFA